MSADMQKGGKNFFVPAPKPLEKLEFNRSYTPPTLHPIRISEDFLTPKIDPKTIEDFRKAVAEISAKSPEEQK